MNCTRVLHAIGSHPKQAVMPVDLAMCLSLGRQKPLYQLLSMSPLTPAQRRSPPTACPPKTGLSSPYQSFSTPYPSSSTPPPCPAPSAPRSCFRKDGAGLNKKRVVFADAKGLALTAVRLFIPESSSPASSLVITSSQAKLLGQQPTLNKQECTKLRLGFPQPSLELKAFLARLRETHVQLESCNISENSFTGKVCVSHASAEKVVNIRVTFDSWRSHHDIPCTFLQQQRRGGSDMDVFAFDLLLPKSIDSRERVEFCVYFKPGPGATPHWDDNRGQNYRVYIEKDGPNVSQSDANRFYPSLSRHRPLSWSSNGYLNMQNSAENPYFQRSLSNRVKADYKNLCLTK